MDEHILKSLERRVRALEEVKRIRLLQRRAQELENELGLEPGAEIPWPTREGERDG